jgi:hypothetical protein
MVTNVSEDYIDSIFMLGEGDVFLRNGAANWLVVEGQGAALCAA